MKNAVLENLTEADVASLGTRLASALFRGAFIALYGDLGAGKTTLTKAVAHALGIENVQSPTFTIVREYVGKLPLFHFDAYRLSDADELFAIGFDDYLSRGGVIMMEWCENVPDALPEERLEVRIKGSGDERRTIELIALGRKYEALLEEIV